MKPGNREIAETLEEVVIRIEGLRKRYGEVVAVDGLNLTVNRGEVFGILGPNGAGKTTTLETIEGLRKPDAGEIEVAGYDAVRESEDLKRIIGVQLQSTALFDYLTVRETLKLFADLYGAGRLPGSHPGAARRHLVDREGEVSCGEPLRRPAAASLSGLGSGERPEDCFIGRADDGARSSSPSQPLGSGATYPKRGQDRGPRHPLHGGG
jgi:ABC-type Fe3+/spermidine/putrescine transport system ATPase subunit